MQSLLDKNCRRYDKDEPPLDSAAVDRYLTQVDGWEHDSGRREINKTFTFKNYYETMAFVNALAWIAHREDHHPDIEVGYKTCKVRFTTHSVGGLSENDFICAARLDRLLQR